MAVNSPRKARLGGGIGLRDIARLASVDISTASRALNHDPRVSPDRADQIRGLAEKLGYRPRPLRSKRARSVGVLICTADEKNTVDNFVGRIAWLAQRSLAERRLHVNLECVNRLSADGLPFALPAVVQQNRVDGVLLGGHPPVELVVKIRELGMPAVAINDSVERLTISCVRSNPEPAMRQALLHLAARGHQAFALLTSSMEYPTIAARHRSYVESLREIAIEPDRGWVIDGLSADIAGGREGIGRLLARGSQTTAILCENDWMALGAMQELQRRGLHVPRDVSVVGHDDIWVCTQLEPKLTSIHRAEEALVSGAIDLLMEQIESGSTMPPRECLVEGEMVWRESTGPAPQRLRESKSIKSIG